MVMPISDKEYIADLGECMTKLEADLAALREENARLTEKLARCVEALELGLALAEGALIDFKHYGLKTDDDISKRIETALAAAKGE